MNLFNLKEYNWKILLHPRKFFLQNLGLKQTLIKNTFWLGFADVISGVLKFILFIYIARILGATEYGKFSFSLSFVNLFVVFSSLGIFNIITREFARDRLKENDFSSLFSLKILLTILTFFAIFIGSFFITSDKEIRYIIYILGTEVLLDGFLVMLYSFLRARQKMEYEAFGQIIQTILITVFSLFILFVYPSVKNLALAYLGGTVILLIFALFFFHQRFQRLNFIYQPKIWKDYILLSYPLALSAVVGTLQANVDSTMMGYLKQITQVGWYNAAQKIVQTAFIFISWGTVSFFPVLSKFFKGKPNEDFQKAFDYFLLFIICTILPIICGSILLSGRIINFVYNPTYYPAVFAMQILFFSAALSALATPFKYTLIVVNQQQKIFWVTFCGVIFAIILNLCLLPHLSLYGAALTNLIISVLTLFLFIRFAYHLGYFKIISRRVFKGFLASGFATILMSLFISQSFLTKVSLPFLILMSIFVYFFSFLLFVFVDFEIRRRCLFKKR